MFNPLLSPERTGPLEGFWHFSNSPLNLHFCPTLQGWRDSAHNARSQPGSIQVHQEMLLGGPPLTHSNAGGRTGHSISVMPWRFAPVFSEGLLCGKPLTNINQPSPVLPEIGGIEILLNCRLIIDKLSMIIIYWVYYRMTLSWSCRIISIPNMAIGLFGQSLENGSQSHAAGSIVASFMLIFETKCSLAQLWGGNSEQTIPLQNVYVYIYIYVHCIYIYIHI